MRPDQYDEFPWVVTWIDACGERWYWDGELINPGWVGLEDACGFRKNWHADEHWGKCKLKPSHPDAVIERIHNIVNESKRWTIQKTTEDGSKYYLYLRGYDKATGAQRVIVRKWVRDAEKAIHINESEISH